MDYSALRPRPMPGQEPSGTAAARSRGDGSAGGHGPRHQGAKRRGRRSAAVLSGLGVAAVLVLCGVGIGTVGATVTGMTGATEKAATGGTGRAAAKGAPAAGTRALAAEAPAGAPRPRTPRSAPPPARAATLGIEAVDAPRGPGALVVGVHVPGPGHTAGLVRGDTLLAVGGTRVGSAAGLAARIAAARPGEAVTLTVRHAAGGRQLLTVRPGVAT